MLASLVAALRFLTRLPIPGLATAAVFAAGLRWWPPPVAAVPAVGFGLMLTGGFHEDGATDAADGLGGGWTNERVVEIMRDSRIGAYGSMALWVLLALRWAALAALGRRALVVLPLAMAWGRWSIPVMLAALPPVTRGLASEVHAGMGRRVLPAATLLVVLVSALAWALGCRQAWQPAAAAGVTVAAWIAYLRQRLGGQSGDLLGAGNQLVEGAVLLVLLAR